MDATFTEKAQSALGRHDWREAFDLLSQADAARTLGTVDLELLAQASWWVGRMPAAIEARERAYAAAIKAGDIPTAAVAAIKLARDNVFSNAPMVGAAWLSRAERLLADVPDSPAHGWFEVIQAFRQADSGHLQEALVHTMRAREIAQRFGDRDLEVFALSCHGRTLVYLGRVEEGLAALDEAAIAAVAGELDPQTAGSVCCNAIGAGAALGDWARAAQWTEAQDRWCQREHINGFPGMCRLYRAEAKQLRGDWLGAEAEARRATDELAGFLPIAVGLALYEIGVIRLRRGDLPAAEDALTRAHALNREPEPALSLLRLAQGNVALASASIQRALDEPPGTPTWGPPPSSDINRIALLPAAVEIALAAGDVERARAAANALQELSQRYTSVAVAAGTAAALGAVLVAEGDPAAAITSLRRSIELWRDLDAPYEGNRARVVLAAAYAADGAPDRAILELHAARSAFERLGAAIELKRADERLAALSGSATTRPTTGPAERATRTFMFTDIVDSTKYAELMGDAAWHDLLRWHDQALRSAVAEHDGEEIKSVGDGFFLAFDSPDQAIDAAVAIQRSLATHRQTNGFAPAVRIGIHRAEADRAGLDYVGTGVNTAARVGAQATAGEILVSAPTLEGQLRPRAELGRRTAQLKGLKAPVEMASIEWH